MKKIMWTLMMVAAFAGGQMAKADTDSDVAALRAEVAELRAKSIGMPEQVSRLVRSEVMALQSEMAMAQTKDGNVISLAKADKLTIGGDFRLRWESTDSDVKGIVSDTSVKNDNFRYRMRLGGVWKTADAWEVGFQLATAQGGTTSRNQTAGSSWASKTIGIDRMYAKHTWTTEDAKIALIAGKMANPFVTSWIFFDGDYTPEGIALQASMDMFFLNAGVFYFNDKAAAAAPAPRGQPADEYVSVIQLGVADKLDNLNYKVAAAYWYLNDAFTKQTGSSSARGKDYQLRIGDLYAEIGTKVGDVGLTFYGDIWKNFGADTNNNVKNNGRLGLGDPNDQNTGWTLGVKAKYDKFTASYDYARYEADSNVFGDSDFLFAGTGEAKGHKLGLSYTAARNLTVGVTAIMVKDINGDKVKKAGTEYDGTVWQVDAVYSF